MRVAEENKAKSIAYEESADPRNHEWPTEELAEKSLKYALEYFLRHTHAIQQKLEIAKEATALGIADLEKVCAAYDFDDGMPVLKNVRGYEAMWDDILQRFEKGGLAQDELDKIDETLQRIPEIIKKHYTRLLESHEALQQVLEEIQGEDYQQALALAQDVQAKPNPMSGLTQKDYGYPPKEKYEEFILIAFV